MTSPVLVTGGTGRLGRSVVARLVEAGQEVRVLARRQRDTQPQATFFTGDLRRGDGIDPAVRAAGVIIHCATSTLPPPGHTEGVTTWDQFLAEELAEHRDPAARVKSA